MADRRRFSAVLFDLDGTLVETRRDIASAVNAMLEERGLLPLPVERVADHVGSGARVLVARCLAECGVASPRPDEIESAYERFHARYLERLLDSTHAYPGIVGLMERIRAASIPMGVVTNKPIVPTERILQGLGLAGYFGIVLGMESLPERKPHPAPLLHAWERLASNEGIAVLAGDMLIDIEAARAASLPVAAVTWGYTPREILAAAAPDFLADDAASLGDWILL